MREFGSLRPGEGAPGPLRRDLALRLERREARLAEQARIFVPLVALALIAAIPIWATSLNRFLKLLASPFVLLPVGFCILHLTISWVRVIRTRRRLRRLDHAGVIRSARERAED